MSGLTGAACGNVRKEHVMRKYMRLLVVAALIGCSTAVVVADEPPTTEQMRAAVERLKARLEKLEKQVKQNKEPGISREETVKLIEEAKAAGMEIPKWLKDLKFSGDLRLRYQGQCYSGQDRNRKSRHRGRFRIRFGVKKTWLDKQIEVGFRLASGSSDDPTSTNQTFDGHFSEKQVWIDRAYAKYKPKWFKGFTVVGGKIKNPLVHTNLIWDSDVNPEGAWAQYKPKLGRIKPFASAGYFVLDESGGGHDTALSTYQAGFDLKIAKNVKWTSAATYYDFDHIDTSYRAANGNNVVGGVLAAKKFHMINVTNKVKFKVLNIPMKAYFDFVHNCGDEDTTVGYRGQDNGYAVGAKIGKNKKKGDWSASYKYAYIEANATPGGLNDSDFGHSNRKGHVVGVKYNLTKFLTLGGKAFYTEPVCGNNEDQRDFTAQVDLVWKF